ncbi:Anhydromuropeptide permease [Frigidibacter albus]|uniref:Transmembrane transporter n=1 Tax=Frigidibacter mobilis TaxID=1335048 RepID=A0A161HBR0_9RHOB|nr:transmembrane transporter [Frigidibacter mobilis]
MTSPLPPAPSLDSTTGSSPDLLRRYLVLAVLYLAEGVPGYVLVAAVPPILREQGVSRATIGMLSLLLLPMALKFLWAPLIERFRPLPLGPRRAWILPTQIGSAACVLALGMIQPTDIPALVAIALALIVLASSQGIATDGYAVLSLQPHERPTGNAIQGAAVAASVIVGGTMSLVLYQHVGWQVTMTIMAGLTLLPLLVLPLMHEDVAPPTARPRPRLRHFFARPEAVSVLGLALFYRASEGLVKSMEGPYLVDSGMSLDWIGYLSGASAATVGLGGSALAALAVRRHGPHGTLVLLGSLRSLCFAVFALHSLGILGGLYPIGTAAVFQTMIRYMEIVALYSLFMQVCSSDQPGTDFTLLACAQLIVYQLGGMAAGHLAEALGYGGLFVLATAISMLATWATRRHATGFGRAPGDAGRA